MEKRALISVYDKTGVGELASALLRFGFEIVSSGGTAKHLRGMQIPVTLVESVTKFPEGLDGRVKTLHPRIHAGILAQREKSEHVAWLAEHGIVPIDLVVVNLYPFFDAPSIENIDIGGPSLIRAAAKNHISVAVLTAPEQYRTYCTVLKHGISDGYRQNLATQAFKLTAEYDAAIAKWFVANTLDRSRAV